MNDTKTLPHPVGTVLRCTRSTSWGDDVMHGVVREWHNYEGWVVVNPDGGIVAAPGPEMYLGSRTAPDEWSFEVIGR